MSDQTLVQVRGLKKWFPVQRSFIERLLTRQREFIHAVDGIDFEILRGEVLGLVGESGSGKTTTGRLILRLVDPTEGSILFEGTDLATLSAEEMRQSRRRMQAIFQDPFASLNPRMKCGDAIGHSLEIFRVAEGEKKRQRVLEMMEQVGLSPASILYDKYPHQLSGGQRQRAVIARALVLNPELVVADEPIAMADVSVRALLLELMLTLKEKLDLTYLYITHDLATAKYICDRIAIMYLGLISEMGTLQQVYRKPLHPYTQALLTAVPVPDPQARRTTPLPKGEIPSPISPPSGCRFHPRCPIAKENCATEVPEMRELEPGHFVACHYEEQFI
ncbi:MAG: ATP-binding cassette domain-containing protein [Anaerolineales bacterium]|nr:ATP-binding cassette domain-containing protein [Anaerolineales bacterium]